MKIIDYLRENPDLDKLQEKYGITHNLHEDGRVILNYHQIDSYKHKFNDMVRECRGLTLDTNNDFELVARSFTRFFNLGEHRTEQDKFIWDDCVGTSKEDGSLITLYFWNGDIHINTRNSYGDGQVGCFNKTWRQLFFDSISINSLRKMDPRYTYVFELCSMYNKIVRTYAEPTLYLLTTFNGEIEHTHGATDAIARGAGLNRPFKFNFTDIFNVQGELSKLASKDPTFEGFVIRDRNNRRLKAKSERYVELHRVASNGNVAHPKNLVQFILDGEQDEVLCYFPELTEVMVDTQSKIDIIKEELSNLWFCHHDEKNQKKFAKAVKHHPFSSVLFSARKLGVNPIDLLNQNKDLIVKRLFK